MKFFLLRHPTAGDRAYYLAPTAARAQYLFRTDCAIGKKDRAHELAEDDVGEELLALAGAREWREGFLGWVTEPDVRATSAAASGARC